MTVEPPGRDAEMRRRAAWLLGMLALVAALFVALMVTFLNGSGGDPNPDNADATDLPTSTSTPASTKPAPTTSRTDGSTSSDAPTTGGTDGTSGTSGPSGPDTSGPKTCPTAAACAFDTDIGDAVTAINAYRTKHNAPAVPGSVSGPAKQCALNKGTGCPQGWAETQVNAPNGALAVQSIMEFAHFLEPMKAIQVGWAYDPAEKQYHFAIIRVQ